MKLENGDVGWDEYLNYFAQGIANIRLGLDMNIIVGGKIAKYMKQHLPILIEKIKTYPALKYVVDFLSIDSDSGRGSMIIFSKRSK